ncbi:MAG: hypothetical protein V7K18_11040 [Nostoc sp.]
MSTEIIRGYAVLLEIIQGLVTAPVLLFNTGAIATFYRYELAFEVCPRAK